MKIADVFEERVNELVSIPGVLLLEGYVSFAEVRDDLGLFLLEHAK